MVLLDAALFLVGAAILVYSVEELIENIAKLAVTTGISAFLLAVVFAGMDFENWAFGVAAVLGGLPGVAIGSAFGSALFLVGVSVALAGFVVPFEPRIPRDYLLLLAISPLLTLPVIIDGRVSRVDGAVLLVVFAGILAYLYWKETSGRETFRDEETSGIREAVEGQGRGQWQYLGLVVLFTVGMVVGSELAIDGAQGIISTLGLDGTVFGMTVAGLVMSIEELLLVVEPIRNGRTSIAVGNIIGSLIFFATGNVGLLGVVSDFGLAPSVLRFYWPAMFLMTLLTAIFLYRGRIKRTEGAVFGILYVGYWLLSYLYL